MRGQFSSRSGHENSPRATSPAPVAAHALHGSPSLGAGSHLLFDFLHLSHAACPPLNMSPRKK